MADFDHQADDNDSRDSTSSTTSHASNTVLLEGSQSSGTGDTEQPKLPKQASHWKIQHAEELGIFYKPAPWVDIFGAAGITTPNVNHFVNMAKKSRPQFYNISLGLGLGQSPTASGTATTASSSPRRPGQAGGGGGGGVVAPDHPLTFPQSKSCQSALLLDMLTHLMRMVPVKWSSRDVSNVAEMLVLPRPQPCPSVGQPVRGAPSDDSGNTESANAKPMRRLTTPESSSQPSPRPSTTVGGTAVAATPTATGMTGSAGTTANVALAGSSTTITTTTTRPAPAPVLAPEPHSAAGEKLLVAMEHAATMICKDLKDQSYQKTMARETLEHFGHVGEDLNMRTALKGVEQFAEKVRDFLEEFVYMLVKCQRGRPSREDAFKNLFVTFAMIFRIKFRPGSGELNREMEIFGQKVNCEPDLRYEMLEQGTGAPETSASSNVLVVTVVEVKRHVPRKEDSESRNNISTRHSAKRRELDHHEDDFVLDDNIKGQHAAELLAEIPYSILKSGGDRKIRVLGLIVQSTKVRLTCLEIGEDHFHHLNKERYSPPKERAYISFSKALDVLVKEDWDELVEIMLTLGSIGQQQQNPLLDLLTAFSMV